MKISHSSATITKKQRIYLKNVQSLNGHFFQEDIQMTKRHMKRHSTSLVIRGMQTKTTMRYHLIPVKMVIINKTRSDKCWTLLIVSYFLVCLVNLTLSSLISFFNEMKKFAFWGLYKPGIKLVPSENVWFVFARAWDNFWFGETLNF